MNSLRYAIIIKIPITLSIYIIFTFSSFYCIAEEKHAEFEDSIELRQIDIKKDTVLYDIILNSIAQDSVRTYTDYYHVSINEYKNGHFVTVIKSNNNLLKTTVSYDGYAIINGYTITFYTANYYLSRYTNHKTKYFKSSTKKQFFSEDSIVEQWYYYIIDDIYAKYDQDKGWLWSDGKPDE